MSNSLLNEGVSTKKSILRHYTFFMTPSEAHMIRFPCKVVEHVAGASFEPNGIIQQKSIPLSNTNRRSTQPLRTGTKLNQITILNGPLSCHKTCIMTSSICQQNTIYNYSRINLSRLIPLSSHTGVTTHGDVQQVRTCESDTDLLTPRNGNQTIIPLCQAYPKYTVSEWIGCLCYLSS